MYTRTRRVNSTKALLEVLWRVCSYLYLKVSLQRKVMKREGKKDADGTHTEANYNITSGLLKKPVFNDEKKKKGGERRTEHTRKQIAI